MSDFNRGYARSIPADRADMSVDAGLRSFMLGVYNKVALGLVVSAALAYLTGQFAPVRDLLYVVTPDGRLAGMTMLGMIIGFAPLAVMLFGMFALRNASPRSSGIFYWTIVALIGAGLGVWTLLYTGASIATTFLITATAFGGLSLFGYTTKKDLTGFGSFLIVGLIGLVIASIVNIFLRSDMMQFMISVLGVFIFAGLIAYDTQRLKMTYYELGGNQAAMGVATNYGALSLYINFINLFQFLLQFFGQRR
ncbi:Bax inhibitor-1/YccA family protein [Phenylobacterium sp. J426]|uniref:Bax inhibitor-1/YccA family protein n=1 Tax=Phenylobacterium sp. J426 TaxID=2898439 RepID=UPI0021508D98|nr:Bax inhibitor-1/YccA family protein [Phenylobacterium sp. J426]MCR5873762.1 Bax inhibitor-1/YccA family protein [Phenylobacterium sp. J426]